MDNRTNILDHALNLFATRGYDAVSVQDIVDAAQIGKPTLYHYFGSKQGVLEALLQAHFEEINAQLKNAAAYARDLPLTLSNIATTLFQLAEKYPAFYRLQLALWFAPPDGVPHQTVSQWNMQQYQILEDLFVSAAQDHGNMRGRQRAYATTFLGMINNYIGIALNGYASLSQDLARQAVHQFMHGIYS
jgi:AcrR family transcriptional regulator